MESIKEILYRVRQPSQYLGCEVNVQRKNPARVECRVALVYPDLYEIGMSYLGMQVLYDALNRTPDLYAERVFAPYPDMREELAKAALPLCSLETRTPLSDFDIVGFTLQHDLNYPDVLAMLQMGSIPTRSDRRTDRHPIVIAGGPCATNPEPLAPAIDAVFLGDAEKGLVEIARIIGRARRRGSKREAILDELMHQTGVYLPSRYQVNYGKNGRIDGLVPHGGAPSRVRRRLVPDIDDLAPPARFLVPCSSTVHDRLTVEIQRGCTRGCRFCQAGMINRPVRQRSIAKILDATSFGLAHTGYEQASFLSLSAGDHPQIIGLLEGFFERHAQQKISASLPSLRAETLTPRLARLMKTVRKTGFTIAPEAGSERLRRVINKQLTDEDVLQAAGGAFEAGWEFIKLYFMIGLPTEQKEDHDGIVNLVDRIKKIKPKTRRRNPIHVGLSTFVPKAHTPFQWEAMIGRRQSYEIQKRLRENLKSLGGVKISFTRVDMSWAEGVLARGDRRQFELLEFWVREGGRLAGWSEHFQVEGFEKSFGACSEEYRRARAPDQNLPWDHLDIGPDRAFLWQERNRAYAEEPTPDCTRSDCHQCGACPDENVLPVLDSQPAHNPLTLTAVHDRNSEENNSRIRLRLTKTGLTVHLSHIEYMKAIMRALRRADWPLAYSQGFHPKPKISFGPACPVGTESFAEWADVGLTASGDPDELLDPLRGNLPEGIELLSGACLPEKASSIMKDAEAVRYRIRPCKEVSVAFAKTRADALMQKREWKVTRQVKGKIKTVDVRLAILDILVQSLHEGVEAVCEIALHQDSSARPLEIAQEVFGTPEARVVREEILFRPVRSEHVQESTSTMRREI